MTKNRYVDVLGAIALFGLALGVVGIMIHLVGGGTPSAVLTSPIVIIGGVCGLLWLSLKAILSQMEAGETRR